MQYYLVKLNYYKHYKYREDDLRIFNNFLEIKYLFKKITMENIIIV